MNKEDVFLVTKQIFIGLRFVGAAHRIVNIREEAFLGWGVWRCQPYSIFTPKAKKQRGGKNALYKQI